MEAARRVMRFYRTLTACFLPLNHVNKFYRQQRTSPVYLTMSSISNNGMDQICTDITSIYSNKEQKNLMSVFVTGGGVQILEWLFTVPGASNSVLDAGVPYSREAMNELLHKVNDGQELVKYCSAETATKIAKAAFLKNQQYLITASARERNPDVTNSNLFGVGCTAALATNRPKKDSFHRCYIALHDARGTTSYTVELQKDARSRSEEDFFCSKLMLDAIKRQCNIALEVESPLQAIESSRNSTLSDKTATISYDYTASDDILDKICSKRAKHALFFKKLCNNAKSSSNNPLDDFSYYENVHVPPNTLVYSGSFNPLHEGHLRLVGAELSRQHNESVAAGTTDGDGATPLVVFEIAAVNADKPPLTRDVILQRLQQFDAIVTQHNNMLLASDTNTATTNNNRFLINNYAVSITSEPLFVEKAKIFRNCTFVIGADTFTRLIDLKYYALKAPIASKGVESSNDVNVAAAINTSSSSHGDKFNNNTTPATEINTSALLNMIVALTSIKESGSTFVVGGRVAASQDFQTLSMIMQNNEVAQLLPTSLTSMFVQLSEDQFRVDLSSTMLRERLQRDK